MLKIICVVFKHGKENKIWKSIQKEDFLREVQERYLDQVQVCQWTPCRRCKIAKVITCQMPLPRVLFSGISQIHMP